MSNFFALAAVAVVVEGIVSYANMIFSPEKQIKWECVAAVALGVIIAVAYNLDLLAAFGVESALPFAGNALTGVLLSRGSNYLSDLIKVVTNLNQGFKKEIQ